MRRHAVALAGLGCAIAGLLGACSENPSATSAASTTTTVGPTRSPGCGRPVPEGSTARTLTFGGVERPYLLSVPAGYTGESPVPVVVNYHGFGSNHVEQAVYSGLPEAASERGWVVVTPRGTFTPAFWNVVGLPAPDDVSYTGALLDSVGAELCLDSTRTYAAGISNGAGMSTLLACELASRIAAIGPVGGANLVAPCSTGPPVSVMAFHGTDDRVLPYAGGDLRRGRLAGRSILSVEDALAAWGAHDGCEPEAEAVDVSASVDLVQYLGCAGGSDVMLYTVNGGGHTWPGSPIDVPRLGPVTAEVDATALLLDFFEDHPLPAGARPPG